jgi:hypothetical protein
MKIRWLCILPPRPAGLIYRNRHAQEGCRDGCVDVLVWAGVLALEQHIQLLLQVLGPAVFFSAASNAFMVGP